MYAVSIILPKQLKPILIRELRQDRETNMSFVSWGDVNDKEFALEVRCLESRVNETVKRISMLISRAQAQKSESAGGGNV